MELSFLLVLFFVVVFAALLELGIRCPLAVAAIVAVISLVVYGFFFETFGTIFIAWIVIYTLAAWVTAVITCMVLKKIRNNNGCGRNDF